MYVTVLQTINIYMCHRSGTGAENAYLFVKEISACWKRQKRKDVLDGRGEEGGRRRRMGSGRMNQEGRESRREEEIQKLECHAHSLLFFGKSQPTIPEHFNVRANIYVQDIHTLPTRLGVRLSDVHSFVSAYTVDAATFGSGFRGRVKDFPKSQSFVGSTRAYRLAIWRGSQVQNTLSVTGQLLDL